MSNRRRSTPVPSRDSFAADVMQGVAEIEAMIRDGARPEDRFIVRTVRLLDVRPPRPYSATDIKGLRQRLDVSQAVFADLVGVSPAVVGGWERGTRQPAPIACRLLDAIAADPVGYVGRLAVSA